MEHVTLLKVFYSFTDLLVIFFVAKALFSVFRLSKANSNKFKELPHVDARITARLHLYKHLIIAGLGFVALVPLLLVEVTHAYVQLLDRSNPLLMDLEVVSNLMVCLLIASYMCTIRHIREEAENNYGLRDNPKPE